MKNKDVRSNASNLHKDILKAAEEAFPGEVILQEESIRVDDKTLFLDIYLPRLKIAIECDGVQHEKFNKFFHRDIATFAIQKKNDQLKELYCKENAISLIRMSYKDEITVESLSAKVLEELKKDAE